MINKWLDKDLFNAIDKFHSKFESAGFDGRGSKSMSQKALAQVIEQDILPNFEFVNFNKRRGEMDFKLKMF
jgi:hypothetical protein